VLAKRLSPSYRLSVSKPALDGSDRPTEPPTLARLGVSLLWDNLAGLFALNLIGTILATPLIVAGLALGFGPAVVACASLYLVAGGLIGAAIGELRGEPGSLWRRAGRTVLSRWRPLLLLGLFTSGAMAGGLVTTARVLDDPRSATPGLIALWLAQCAFLVLLVVLLIYALPLIAAYGAGIRPALRNALVLAIAAPLQTLGMLGLLVGLTIATLWVGPGIWLIVPVVAAVFLGVNCWLQVERWREGSEPAPTEDP
jgi:hypothetical protein